MIKDILRNIKVRSMHGSLIEPCLLKDSDDSSIISMNDSFIKKMYSDLGLSLQLSKKIHSIDKKLWDEAISIKLESSDHINDFNFRCLMIDTIAIENVSSDNFDESKYNNYVDKFISNIESFDNYEEVTSYISNTTRVILSNDDSDSIVILELNFNSGWYSVYTGFKLDKVIYLYEKPCMSTSNITDLIMSEDFIINQYNITKKFVIPNMNFDTRVSARELIDFIKRTGSDVSVDEDTGLVDSLSGFSLDDSILLSNAINSFNIPYKALKKIKFIRKSLKISDITFSDLNRIIFDNYLEGNLDISCDLISSVSNNPSKHESDKMDIEAEGIDV